MPALGRILTSCGLRISRTKYLYMHMHACLAWWRTFPRHEKLRIGEAEASSTLTSEFGGHLYSLLLLTTCTFITHRVASLILDSAYELQTGPTYLHSRRTLGTIASTSRPDKTESNFPLHLDGANANKEGCHHSRQLLSVIPELRGRLVRKRAGMVRVQPLGHIRL
jgi:hypothetical protein